MIPDLIGIILGGVGFVKLEESRKSDGRVEHYITFGVFLFVYFNNDINGYAVRNA
jgi:hypothetical protein